MYKKLFTILRAIFICTPLVCASCASLQGAGLGGAIPGSDNIVTKTREVGAFNAITLDYPAEVTLQQGAEDSVEITADDNLLPQITTVVSAGRLTIRNQEEEWKHRVNPSRLPKITVTVKDLKEIEFRAPAGELAMDGFEADTLDLLLNGGGEVKLSRVNLDHLVILLSGKGDIQADGTVKEVQLTLSGMGNFNGADLECDQASIEISGVGDATLRIESKLMATISGTGSVNYYGTPHIEQNVTGIGSVQPAE